MTKIFLNSRSIRRDRFRPEIDEIGAIPTNFRPFEVCGDGNTCIRNYGNGITKNGRFGVRNGRFGRNGRLDTEMAVSDAETAASDAEAVASASETIVSDAEAAVSASEYF